MRFRDGHAAGIAEGVSPPVQGGSGTVDDVKRYYRGSLGSKIEAVEAALADLGRDDGESVRTLRRIVHSLRGSGTTFGFPEVTVAAAEVEAATDTELAGRLQDFIALLKRIASGMNEEKIRILVVDDDPDIQRLLQDRLAAKDREILLAGTGEKALEILAHRGASLVLLDLVLPDIDGRDLLLSLKEDVATAALPVIVISMKGGAAKAECFTLGADEYLEKPLDAAVVAATVGARLQHAAEITRGSRRDLLTGLSNRAAFTESFNRMNAESARMGTPISLAMFDLDHFKDVNDGHGHAAGDEVLRRVAGAVSGALRQSDLLARWGGEEFVVLMPYTDLRGAVLAIEKGLEAFREEEFTGRAGETFRLSFSAGVEQLVPGAPLEEGVASVDRMLYLAKAAGRNRVVSSAGDQGSVRPMVLLAEDDEQSAWMVRRLLEQEGLEVAHFPDGKAALEFARNSPPIALVILDIVMPGADGLEALSRLRKLPAYRTVPVVMLTSLGSDADVACAFAFGADDYIPKPFSQASFMARIRRHLRRR